jgi:nucleotide-binding universal stress UspA family protein
MGLARILCPVDMSEPSRRAFDCARALAEDQQAELIVLHVVDTTLWTGLAVDAMRSLSDARRNALSDELEWWVARRAGDAVPIRTEVREGPVRAVILDAVSELSIDLIVMATHGRSGFERFVLGSVTEKVLRRVPCPVLTVPSHAEAIVRPGGRGRIVCATDGSELSKPALARARALAESRRAPLSVISVVAWPEGESPSSLPEQVLNVRRRLEEQAAVMLAQLVEGWESRPDLVVRFGKPGRQIVAYAAQVQAELIVVGVSGRGALDRMLLGATAHEVVRDAACPVLCVPADAG